MKLEPRTLDPETVRIEPMRPADIPQVLDVVSRGMRDNPMHVAVFGDDPDRRIACQRALLGAGFRIAGLDRHMLVARRPDGTIVGACGVLPPDEETPSGMEQLRFLREMLKLGPRTTLNVTRWLGAWARLHLKQRHWHVGPVAVDLRLQGQGIGSRLMQALCARLDAAGELAYLETDKLINVSFYERFGFEVVHREDVLGVPNWFMRRDPQPVTVE